MRVIAACYTRIFAAVQLARAVTRDGLGLTNPGRKCLLPPGFLLAARFTPPVYGIVRCTPIAPIPAAQLRLADAGQTVRLSGWVHRKRDHGNLLFVDLRDHYGITQCVRRYLEPALPARSKRVRLESVVTVTGRVVQRTRRDGQSEAADRRDRAADRRISSCSPRPSCCRSRSTATRISGEDMRLTYRFLDLRRERIHRNIMLRSQVIASIRRRMIEQGFTEFQTPILTSSSPEGARDYPGAEPAASRQVLRAAAGAAAVQAAADGRRLRPLFPDRALLSRRGQPRRPLARRVLSARFRDVLRDPGGRLRRDRAGAAWRLRGVQGRAQGAARRPSRASPTTRRC